MHVRHHQAPGMWTRIPGGKVTGPGEGKERVVRRYAFLYHGMPFPRVGREGTGGGGDSIERSSERAFRTLTHIACSGCSVFLSQPPRPPPLPPRSMPS